MTSYNPADHYWIVAGNEARLWSSVAASYVATDDAAYLAWRADDRLPTSIASEPELDEVLIMAGHGDRAPNPPKRRVEKTLIVARLAAAGKIAAAKAALEADPSAWARWVAPVPAINHDDPEALALLAAIGADPPEIMAP